MLSVIDGHSYSEMAPYYVEGVNVDCGLFRLDYEEIILFMYFDVGELYRVHAEEVNEFLLVCHHNALSVLLVTEEVFPPLSMCKGTTFF